MRLLPVLAVVGVLLTGCGTEAPTPPPKPKPAPTATGGPQPSTGMQRIAVWDQIGGYVPGPQIMDAPHVVVYADGTVIIDAERRLQLSPLEVTQLRGALEWNLAGMPPKNDSVGGPSVDGVANRLTARAASGALLKVEVDGLVTHSTVPKRVRDAFARLDLLSGQTGTVFAADRLCAMWTSPSSLGVATPWPAGVSIPGNSPELQRLADAQAQALAAAVPNPTPAQRPAVHRLRTDAGADWLLQWRYQLPDEPLPSHDPRTCAG